ncbi:uncharacterized protein [Elaeis guineensis]|uniref:Uncharacterized protein LOC105041899 n=1 Tax=Elaeis guineensis var. tenera TaxID=51953 RepID=A0A6I9QZX0_ELAGV|nr:uncharacterized protein LOC105041899 [Elaeis guineensis]
MRIRRRPPLPSLSSPAPPLQTPDPSLFHPQPPHKGEATKEKGVGEEGEGEGLHQDGDLQIESHGWGMDPINGDPAPSGAGHPTTGRRQERSTPPFFASPHPTLNHGQVLKEVKKQEEMVDSSKRWNAQVNSDKRIGSSSSAPVSEESKLGETAFLPKKRRGGHDDDDNGDGRSQEKPVDKEKTAKPKARAKASSQVENNCTSANGGDTKGSDGVLVNGNIGSNGKKRRSPAVLMEGSRCSRVNGRGWRCSQQTLVGYSLCEHHLGKGRLRSMSSVRGQGSGNKPKKSTEGGGDGVLPLSFTTQEDEKNARDKQPLGGDNEAEDMEEKQEKKKRKKIGMVKARTISSLLDETNHSVPLTPSPSSAPPPPLEPASVQSHNRSETIV